MRVSSFDDQGNQLMEDWHRQDGTIYSKTGFMYENYDLKGNWLKKTVFHDGKPVEIVEKVIEYYS
jgi:hypothetical protein